MKQASSDPVVIISAAAASHLSSLNLAKVGAAVLRPYKTQW